MYGWVSTFKPYATSFPVLLMLVKLPYLCQKGFIDISTFTVKIKPIKHDKAQMHI